MTLYTECRNVLNRKPLDILNEDFEAIGTITYLKPKEDYNVLIQVSDSSKQYKVKTNPIKLKPKHIIYDAGNNALGRVSVGVNIIHSIIEAEKYFFVKSAFWKIYYQVYDDRDVVGTLEVVRINKKRYYKIQSKTNDDLIMVSLFLLAQAVRMKAIIS